jgi:hypothetical protein
LSGIKILFNFAHACHLRLIPVIHPMGDPGERGTYGFAQTI